MQWKNPQWKSTSTVSRRRRAPLWISRGRPRGQRGIQGICYSRRSGKQGHSRRRRSERCSRVGTPSARGDRVAGLGPGVGKSASRVPFTVNRNYCTFPSSASLTLGEEKTGSRHEKSRAVASTSCGAVVSHRRAKVAREDVYIELRAAWRTSGASVTKRRRPR